MNKIHSLKSISKEILAQSWTLTYYEDFEEVLSRPEFLKQFEYIVELVTKDETSTSFKWTIDALSFQFLVGVFVKNKEI